MLNFSHTFRPHVYPTSHIITKYYILPTYILPPKLLPKLNFLKIYNPTCIIVHAHYYCTCPLLLPLPTPFTRLATGNTSGPGPILSHVPTNAKVGIWDLDSDLKRTKNLIPFYYLPPPHHTSPVSSVSYNPLNKSLSYYYEALDQWMWGMIIFLNYLLNPTYSI